MNNPTSRPEAVRPARPSRNPIRGLLLAGAFATSFAAGGVVLPSAASAMQDGMTAGGLHSHIGGQMGANHAMAHAHIARLLAAAGATPEQKAKIHAIMKSAFEQIAPVHRRLASLHPELHRILAAPRIDRAGLERLRAESLADIDRVSRILTQALADAAEVLTPEQRARLAAMAGHQHTHLR